jgi:hypothetical protein
MHFDGSVFVLKINFADAGRFNQTLKLCQQVVSIFYTKV